MSPKGDKALRVEQGGGWTDRFPVFYRTLSPSGPLPKKYIKAMLVVLIDMSMIFHLFGQVPQRGRSPVENRGTFVRPFVCLFIHTPKICPYRPEICPIRPEI